jgi:hypothetical protein
MTRCTPSQPVFRVALVAAISLAVLAPDARAASPTAPLEGAQRRHLAAITPDPAPPGLIRDSHYVISNEDRPHLFRASIENVGGALIGVGTEQLYVYAGWARPSVIIPMDFDQVVVDLHRIYGLFFLVADNPDDFLSLWSKKRETFALELVDQAAISSDDRKALRKAWKYGRKPVYLRLKRLRRVYGKGKSPTFITDADTYAYVAGLFRQGRVHMVRGDLTVGGGAMKSIADALRRLDVPVSLLYLSNAEQYFEFTSDYRANIRALPFGENAQILRTFPNGKEGDYTYMTQRSQDFIAWLDQETIKRIVQIRYRRERLDSRDRYRLPAPAAK